MHSNALTDDPMEESELEPAVPPRRDEQLAAPHRPSTGRSLAEFLADGPRWVGDDLEECYQIVVATRGLAEF